MEGRGLGLFKKGLSAARFMSGQKLRNLIEGQNFNASLVKKCLVPVRHWEKQFSQSMTGKRDHEGYACLDDSQANGAFVSLLSPTGRLVLNSKLFPRTQTGAEISQPSMISRSTRLTQNSILSVCPRSHFLSTSILNMKCILNANKSL